MKAELTKGIVLALGLVSLALFGCASVTAGGAVGVGGWLALLGLISALAACTDAPGSGVADTLEADVGPGAGDAPGGHRGGEVSTGDADVGQAFGPDADAADDTWVDCCVTGACYCPSEDETIINYWDFLQGDCYTGGPGDDCPDVPTDIEQGYWEPCCEQGELSTCFCPAGTACNYGWFTTCPDGSCIEHPGAECERGGDVDATDATTPDAETDAQRLDQ